MYDVANEELYGLDTTIDWKNTSDNLMMVRSYYYWYMMKVVSG